MQHRDELVALRKRIGLRSIRVAQMAGIERTRYSLWENGHIELSEDEVGRVSDVLAQELRLIRELQLPRQVTA